MAAWTGADTLRFIEESELFETLKQDTRRDLAAKADARQFAPGQQVIKRGESGDSLFVVALGEVRVVLESPKGEQEVSLLKPGDFFGEIAMMTHAHRTATVTATGESVLIEFSAADIMPIIEQHPKLKARIARTGVQRSQDSLKKMIED
ncbi:MAG TPA: cyclic nucleotide-binding domain-containing protein [Myxococcota bacterium]|nr:cyclic nucleotide-binding domain-containing protein [Myxococcota bacterium]